MLKPSKHLNLDLSLLRISALILSELRKYRLVEFEALRSCIARRAGDDSELVLIPALNLLFLLGRLNYHIKNDTFEYIEPRGGSNAD